MVWPFGHLTFPSAIFYLFAEITRLSHEQIFTSPENQERLLMEHRRIFKAIRKGDAKAARKLMHCHLVKTERWFKRAEVLWNA